MTRERKDKRFEWLASQVILLRVEARKLFPEVRRNEDVHVITHIPDMMTRGERFDIPGPMELFSRWLLGELDRVCGGIWQAQACGRVPDDGNARSKEGNTGVDNESR